MKITKKQKEIWKELQEHAEAGISEFDYKDTESYLVEIINNDKIEETVNGFTYIEQSINFWEKYFSKTLKLKSYIIK